MLKINQNQSFDPWTRWTRQTSDGRAAVSIGAADPANRVQSSNICVCGCYKPTVQTKCSMEWSVSIIQIAAALRNPQTRRVTPARPAHRTSRSVSSTDVIFLRPLVGEGAGCRPRKRGDALPDFSDDNEPEEARAAPRARRCKQSEVHGTVST